MFALFPYLILPPKYNWDEILNNLIQKNDKDVKFLENWKKIKNMFYDCINSYNGSEYEKSINDNSTNFLMLWDNNMTLKDLVNKNWKNKISYKLNFNYSFGPVDMNISNNSLLNLDIITTRISYAMLSNWKFVKKINKFIEDFLDTSKLNLELFNSFKNDFFEGILRLYLLKKNESSGIYSEFDEFNAYPELHVHFIEFLLNIYEPNLSFFIVFNKMNSINLNDIIACQKIVKVSLNKIEKAITYANKTSLAFKQHLVNYLILLFNFFEMILGYFKLNEYKYYINKAEYPDNLNYEQTIFNRNIFAERSKNIYNDIKNLEPKIKEIFNLKLYFKFCLKIYDTFLIEEEEDSIKMYNMLKDKIKKADKSLTTIMIINSITVNNDLVKKSLDAKSLNLTF